MPLFSIAPYDDIVDFSGRDTSKDMRFLEGKIEMTALENIAEAAMVAGVGAVTSRPWFPTRGVTQEYANRIGSGIDALAYDVSTQFVAVDPSTISDSEETIKQKIAFVKSNPTGMMQQWEIDATVSDLQSKLNSLQKAKTISPSDIQNQASFSAGFNDWYKGWKNLKVTVDNLPFIFHADIWDSIQAYEVDYPKWRDAFIAAKGKVNTPQLASVDEQKKANPGLIDNTSSTLTSTLLKVAGIVVVSFVVVELVSKWHPSSARV